MKKNYSCKSLWAASALLSLIFLGNTACAQEPVTITFTEHGAVQGTETDTIQISGTSVTITAPGTYVLEGSCQDGSVTVAKNAGEVELVLKGLELTSTTTAPLSLKGGTTEVTVTAAPGTENVLSDTDREGESPKSAVNASKAITFCGEGSLTINGNNKNGIKSDTDVMIRDLSLQVFSADHGIAADNQLTVNGGNIEVVSGGDAMRSSPDEITGTAAGNVQINGGTFRLTAVGDGIQADGNLTIEDGTFYTKTNGGHTVKLASDAESCKGFKAGDTLAVLGGCYVLDTADDAFHSDSYCYLTSGTFTIATGDDGAHADTSLLVGEEQGEDGKLKISITDCYEGLEAGTVYLYSGSISVVSEDDGINAAGDSGTGDAFQPGGGGGSFPGGQGPHGGGQQIPGPEGNTGDYSINIYGGQIQVDAGGDGLDSNGDITMTGGSVTVFGAAANGNASDNSALDFDGKFSLTGGTVFAAGSAQMAQTPSVTGQNTVVLSKGRNEYAASGKYLNVYSGGEAVFSIQTPKAVNHIFYTSGDLQKDARITVTDEPAWQPPDGSGGERPGGTEGEGETEAPGGSEGEGENEVPGGNEEETEISGGNEAGDQTAGGSGIQGNGSSGQESADQVTEGGTGTVILVPALSTAAQACRCVKLTWTKLEGAVSYQVYRSEKKNGTYQKITALSKTSYTDKGLITGKTYYYKVRARVNGVWQAFSSVKGGKAVPGKAALKSITVKKGKVTLKWKKVSGATGYEIYYSAGNVSGFRKLQSASGGSKTATVKISLKKGKSYSFRVRAYRTVKGKRVYGSFSDVKKKKI